MTDRALRRAVADARRQRWLDENAEAFATRAKAEDALREILDHHWPA